MPLDSTDQRIINRLQQGFPLSERPFDEVARELGLEENALIDRLRALLESGVLSRFGPLYNIEAAGGALSLVAMSVPPDQVESVAHMLEEMPEVAHNYLREHALNMWFVLATETPARLTQCVREIEARTGLRACSMPKLTEYHLELRLDA